MSVLMGIAQAISLGNTNVIVEGKTDPYMLDSMRVFCADGKLPTLAEDVTLFRAGEAGKKMLPYVGFLAAEQAKGVVLLDDDGDTLRLYYGAADTSICVATASLAALLRWLDRHSS